MGGLLRQRRLCFQRRIFVHGGGHPLAGHLQKRFAQLGIAFRHPCQTHALTRVIDTVLVGDLHSTLSHNPDKLNATLWHLGQGYVSPLRDSSEMKSTRLRNQDKSLVGHYSPLGGNRLTITHLGVWVGYWSSQYLGPKRTYCELGTNRVHGNFGG